MSFTETGEAGVGEWAQDSERKPRASVLTVPLLWALPCAPSSWHEGHTTEWAHFQSLCLPAPSLPIPIILPGWFLLLFQILNGRTTEDSVLIPFSFPSTFTSLAFSSCLLLWRLSIYWWLPNLYCLPGPLSLTLDTSNYLLNISNQMYDKHIRANTCTTNLALIPMPPASPQTPAFPAFFLVQ